MEDRDVRASAVAAAVRYLGDRPQPLTPALQVRAILDVAIPLEEYIRTGGRPG